MQTLDQAALQAEYEVILKALIDTNFSKAKAAEKLGIDRKTLYNKLRRAQDDPAIKKHISTANA